MIESLRTTQIHFFRFATLCGFFRGTADEVQKVSVQGFVQEKLIWNHLWEHRFSVPDPRVFPPPGDHFLTPTTESPFYDWAHRQPSNKATKKTRQLVVLRWFPLSSLCSFFVGVVAVFVVLFVVVGGVFRDTKSVILCHFGQKQNICNLFVRLSLIFLLKCAGHKYECQFVIRHHTPFRNFILYMSRWFFENEPFEICSYLSDADIISPIWFGEEPGEGGLRIWRWYGCSSEILN